jgi:3-oxoacyl-[acyl-carrier protein] reductase
MKLKNKAAVVTGAGRGIGRDLGLCLSREGADVAIVDSNLASARKVAKQINAFGQNSIAIETDVTKSESVQTMAKQVINEFGKIDILVNNAGFSRVASVVEMKEDDWDSVINTCLKGTFLCSRALLPAMIEQRSGRIINIASAQAFMAVPNISQYCAAKAGVVAFTKCLAMEVGNHNITVNAIAPGIVDTEGVRERHPDKRIAAWARQTLVGRIASAEKDLGPILILLASEDGSYITGETILVAGGAYMR